MYYTYILICSDNSYYTGSTSNLGIRIKDHNSGKGADFTLKRLPCDLVWYKKFNDKNQALKKENEIKKISRDKKEKLIFQLGNIWKHYKGGKYRVIGLINDLIVYSDFHSWKNYYYARK